MRSYRHIVSGLPEHNHSRQAGGYKPESCTKSNQTTLEQLEEKMVFFNHRVDWATTRYPAGPRMGPATFFLIFSQLRFLIPSNRLAQNGMVGRTRRSVRHSTPHRLRQGHEVFLAGNVRRHLARLQEIDPAM